MVGSPRRLPKAAHTEARAAGCSGRGRGGRVDSGGGPRLGWRRHRASTRGGGASGAVVCPCTGDGTPRRRRDRDAPVHARAEAPLGWRAGSRGSASARRHRRVTTARSFLLCDGFARLHLAAKSARRARWAPRPPLVAEHGFLPLPYLSPRCCHASHALAPTSAPHLWPCLP